jgi:uncharacterized cupredoxin-like copper-binding protein
MRCSPSAGTVLGMRLLGAPRLSLALVTSLVAVGVVGCGGDDAKNDAAAAPSAAGGAIDVALTEYAITPAADTTPAGQVTFDVSNDGAIPHEFVVVRTDTKAGDLLKGAKADETGTVGELDEQALGVKARKTLTLDLKAGHYALICNLPGHYQGGMHTDFTVE